MDKQHRLTRWAEWQVGELYAFTKLRVQLPPRRLIEVNRIESFVRFEDCTGRSVLSFSWRDRFVHIPSPAGGGVP